MPAVAEKADDRMAKVRLTKHYQPKMDKEHFGPTEPVEIVGWTRPAKMARGAKGGMIEIEPEQWMDGEMHPAPVPGAHVNGKVWAGTTISVPVDTARKLIQTKAAERADDL